MKISHLKSSLSCRVKSFSLLCCLGFAATAGSANAAIYTVNSTVDPGTGGCTVSECTLREAITAANTSVGADTIKFNIPSPVPAGGYFSIQVASALPTITEAVTIDGTTQTTFTGNTNSNGPEIDITPGTTLPAGSNGLTITAAKSVIRGLVIRGFPNDGIQISGASADNNSVEGCYIGTSPAGTDPGGTGVNGNGGTGVELSGGAGGTAATGNTIGGATVAQRDVICSNAGAGVLIGGTGTDGNKVLGCYIGIGANGRDQMGNITGGVVIGGGAGATNIPNTVGGAVAGARNIISGNGHYGVCITDAGSDSNVVDGNYIGVNTSGTTAFGNSGPGVLIALGAKNNVIGGSVDLARNIISGNGGSGIRLTDDNTDGNKITGNYIGLNAAGTLALHNSGSGVDIGSYSDGLGSGPGASGVSNSVGGTTISLRNVISGNNQFGVAISGPDSDYNTVQGNYIGTNAVGTKAVPNVAGGVLIAESADHTIICGTSAVPQVISGNNGIGVYITGATTDSNRVLGNFIGTNVAGTASLGNQIGGVQIDGDAGDPGASNVIGGTVISQRNIISGNWGYGVDISGSGTDNNIVQGNLIGTNLSGTGAVPNGTGLIVEGGAANTIVSGSPTVSQVISGNLGNGAVFNDNTTLKFQGNFVGCDISGANPLGNQMNGILVNGVRGTVTTIGGNAAAVRNVIVSNGLDGIYIFLSDTVFVQGNYIGVNAAGTGALGNAGYGVELYACNAVAVGGGAASQRNVISGNELSGIVFDAGTFSSKVQGNYIGVSSDASIPLGNGLDGIDLYDDSNSNTIGGPVTTAGAAPGNIIAGNANDGIAVWEGYSNTMQGNIIGTNATDSHDIANGGNGINLYGVTSSNTIGGSGNGQANRIRFNSLDGVRLADAVYYNAILRNAISANGGLGINLQPDGEAASTVTPNDIPSAYDADDGPNSLQNFPVLTSATMAGTTTTIIGTLDAIPRTSYSIDFFRNSSPDASGYGEGEIYVRSITVRTDNNGHATFTITSTAPLAGETISATASYISGTIIETSEFSNDISVTAPLSAGRSGSAHTF